MKTIDQPKKKVPRMHAIRCGNSECAAVMGCATEELRFESDRDGDAYAYVMKCPHCRTETWIAAEKLK